MCVTVFAACGATLGRYRAAACEPMKDRDLFDFWDSIDGICELPNAS